jgi:hypothetical protein
MEQQGLSQGSLRNSHREIHPVQRKKTPTSLHEQVKKFVEECLPTQIIRRRYDTDKMAPILKKYEFTVLENESKADSGFIVCLPEKPSVYIQFRRSGAVSCILRLRIHDKVKENKGSIFVATLDDVGHTLRIEDVWVWRGEQILESQSYSARREVLGDFVKNYWIPDARLLGGILMTIANPISIEEFLSRPCTAYSVDFMPERAGRTRIWFQVAADAPRPPALAPVVKKALTHAEIRLGTHSRVRPVIQNGSCLITDDEHALPLELPKSQSNGSLIRRVRAMAIDSLPDVFEIYGEDGFPIGRASVQNYGLSQQIRGKKDVWVQAEWNSTFGGYIIKGLV